VKINTKYDGLLEFDEYKERLVKRVYKTLPLMEEGKDWKRYLSGLLCELAGITELSNNADFTSVNGKLNGLFFLNQDEVSEGLFRKMIFDTIDVIKKIELS
jgi:hypothetical protein